MIREELIQAPRDRVRKIIKSLELNSPTKDMAEGILKEKGLKTEVAFLEKEWLNDTLAAGASSEKLSRAIENPTTSFLSFCIAFADNPLEPPDRTVSKLAKKFGYSFTGQFYKIYWPIQIAWADRLRNHDDDLISVCSDLFLKLIGTKGPGKVFSDLLEFSHSQNPSITSKCDNDLSYLSVEEIKNYPLDNIEITPVFIDFIKSTSGKTLSKIQKGTLRSHAENIRAAYLEEYQTLEISCLVEYLEKYPLIYRHMLAMQFLKMSFDSNVYNMLYLEFIESIKSMRIHIPAEELEYEFSKYIDQHGARIRDLVSKNDNFQEVRENVSLLNIRWRLGLPENMQDLGASRSILFTEWRDLVLDKKRGSPPNLVLDYYLFLLENKFL